MSLEIRPQNSLKPQDIFECISFIIYNFLPWIDSKLTTDSEEIFSFRGAYFRDFHPITYT